MPVGVPPSSRPAGAHCLRATKLTNWPAPKQRPAAPNLLDYYLFYYRSFGRATSERAGRRAVRVFAERAELDSPVIWPDPGLERRGPATNEGKGEARRRAGRGEAGQDEARQDKTRRVAGEQTGRGRPLLFAPARPVATAARSRHSGQWSTIARGRPAKARSQETSDTRCEISSPSERARPQTLNCDANDSGRRAHYKVARLGSFRVSIE